MLRSIKKHRTILAQLLKDITQSEPGHSLGFKGGTSLYFLENLPRFSTDLDFDLRENTDLDELLRTVQSIASNYGSVNDSNKGHYTILVVLSYDDSQRNIKIEMNRSKNREYDSEYTTRNWRNITMNVQVLPDQFANKMVALTQRTPTAGRDIFDLAWFYENNTDLNPEIVTQRTDTSLKNYLQQEVLPLVREISTESILNDIGELVQNEQQSKEWIRGSLKDDLIFYIKEHISNLP